MDIKLFIYEIIDFKRKKQIAETEPTTSMLYEKPENLFNKFINNKTGKNLLLEHNIPDNVYASFDAETVDKLIQFIKIQNEIEKEKDDD